MNKHTTQMLQRLVDIGIGLEDANTLRRCSMTLHRWHELECGDSNNYSSWSIVRGRKVNGSGFEYDDSGKPYIERHYHDQNKARYELLADREKGAQKRIAAILAKHPELMAYVQGDPRGCSLYILKRSDVPEGADLDQFYNSRGIAIHK